MPDLSYTPKTDAELDALAVITAADIEHAMQTARELTPGMMPFLEATAEPSDVDEPR